MKTSQALRWLGLAAIPALFALAGCSDPPPIRTYEVPKPEYQDRTLGAMIPAGSQVWFLKLAGPADLVKEKESDFRDLVESLDLSGSEPKWELPAGWDEKPGEGMRFRTLTTEVEDVPLELTVTPLAVSPNIGVASYQLANINRWRNELGLRPIDRFQLTPETEELATRDGTTALLVDLAGERKSSSMGDRMMGQAPFAGLPKDHPEVPQSRSPAAAPESVQLKYDVPEGWKEGPPKAFARASYLAGADGKQVSITLSELGIAGAELLQNINRWRGQVGLPPTTLEALQKDLQKLELAEPGVQADYVRLVGDGTTILGAIAVHADRAWFFKLIGDNALAQQQQANFEAFVKSTRFETSNGN